MPTKAYILIETAVGKSREVANTLTSLPGVQTVDAVTGPYDIIAVVGAPDLNAVGDLVQVLFILLSSFYTILLHL